MKLDNPYQPPTSVEAQATYYSNLVSVFIPRTPILKNYVEPRKKSTTPLEEEFYKKETTAERSIRRTDKLFDGYIRCNEFELFVTFTFATNRYDIDEKRKQMENWLRNQRKRNGRFKYIMVAEFHKDGALHFHALLYGYLGRITKAINPKTGKHIHKGGRPIYDLPEFTLGFTEVRRIGETTEDRMKSGYYLKKYISKDMIVFKNRRRFWNSTGLKKPVLQDNPEKWYEHVKPDWKIITENGTTLKFNVGSNPLVDMYWEKYKP